MADGPRPDCNAIRTPTRTLDGAPIRANRARTPPADGAAERFASRRALKREETVAIAYTVSITATKPIPRTNQSAAKPGSGSTRRAKPFGVSGDANSVATTARL